MSAPQTRSPAPRANADRAEVIRNATSLNAPIVICEGEKTADAAALIFPKSISTTSSGGAGAAAKTDWAPLAGRLVLVWPDADAAGEKYAREVAARLKMFDCSVSIMDAKGLASIDPSGGARDPEKGWDAADAVGEWKDAGALRKAAVGLAKSFDAGPAFVCHGQFEMRADGLWCKIPIKSKKDDQDEAGEIWLSSSFEIPGRARDAQGAQWARMLRFKDADGREHTATVSDAELHGEASALAAKLAHCGLQIATGRGSREKFVAYLTVRWCGRV